MDRVRQRIGDGKLNRLILAFLKSGVLSETQFIRTDSGTPQGGDPLSPYAKGNFDRQAGSGADRALLGRHFAGVRAERGCYGG